MKRKLDLSEDLESEVKRIRKESESVLKHKGKTKKRLINQNAILLKNKKNEIM